MDYLTYFKNKTIVIPGGNGFVGSYIVKKLKKTNAKVFIPQTSDGIDFRKREDCLAYLSITKPDIVINCAANQGGIGYHSGKQADLYMDNILMGSFLMEAAQKVGVKKFVNVVAGCSYPGYMDKDEMNEEDYWNGQIHESIFSYGFSRKASTVYGLALKKQYNFNSIHLIMANMYGPGEHFNPEQSKALAGLIKKVYEAKKKNAKSIEIWGSGKPVRDWLFVEDGVEGILRAAVTYNDVEPLNIGTGVGISITDLAQTIIRIAGYKGKLTYNTQKSDGALHKIFGIHKMKKVLHWIPQTSIEKGIKETYTWFEKNYERAIHY
jgi:GDP-L-fucose synthase